MNEDIIYNRRSIRKFLNKSIPKDIIEEIIKAGIVAPSAKNRQPWKYLIYSGENKNKLLQQMENGIIKEEREPFFKNSLNGIPDAKYTLSVMKKAPVIIMVVNTNGEDPFRNKTPDDRFIEICDILSIGASIENMLLKATELGIGSLWIANTFYAYNELAKFMNTNNEIISAIALGYPEEKPNARPRKSFSDIAEFI